MGVRPGQVHVELPALHLRVCAREQLFGQSPLPGCTPSGQEMPFQHVWQPVLLLGRSSLGQCPEFPCVLRGCCRQGGGFQPAPLPRWVQHKQGGGTPPRLGCARPMALCKVPALLGVTRVGLCAELEALLSVVHFMPFAAAASAVNWKWFPASFAWSPSLMSFYLHKVHSPAFSPALNPAGGATNQYSSLGEKHYGSSFAVC